MRLLVKELVKLKSAIKADTAILLFKNENKKTARNYEIYLPYLVKST